MLHLQSKANMNGPRKSIEYPIILNQKTSVIPFWKGESMPIMVNEQNFLDPERQAKGSHTITFLFRVSVLVC